MFLALLFVLSLIVAAIHLIRDTHPRTPNRIAEIVLLWFLVLLVGVGGVFNFIAHTVYADTTAASIGWPAGNPSRRKWRWPTSPPACWASSATGSVTSSGLPP